MKRVLTLFLSVLLCQCGAVTVIRPDGSIVAHEGFLDEAVGTVFELTRPDGLKITRIASKPNRTRVAGKIVDGVVTYGIANALARESINKNDNTAEVSKHNTTTKAGVEHHKLDNAGLEISGANAVNEINAKK